jgi:hypothetical protein
MSSEKSESSVEVNLTPEMMKEFLHRVAGADGDVVFEFRKDDVGNIEKVIEITDHVRELESEV